VLKILVTFALRQEGVSFEKKLAQRTVKSGMVFGRLDSLEVVICWLGIGVRHWDQLKSALSDFRPGLVINSGFAGGVRTLLEPGDFLLAENFSSTELLGRPDRDRIFEGIGKFAGLESVADSAEKIRLGSVGNVLAIDMESARVAQLCQELSVPLLTARMISDRYNEEVPGVFLGKGIRQMKDISQALVFAGRMIVLRHRLADRLVRLINVVKMNSRQER
jgi:nucleoside phosphorylase